MTENISENAEAVRTIVENVAERTGRPEEEVLEALVTELLENYDGRFAANAAELEGISSGVVGSSNGEPFSSSSTADDDDIPSGVF